MLDISSNHVTIGMAMGQVGLELGLGQSVPDPTDT